MPFLSTNGSVQAPSTNTIYRPIGDIAGLREVHDNVSRLSVAIRRQGIAGKGSERISG